MKTLAKLRDRSMVKAMQVKQIEEEHKVPTTKQTGTSVKKPVYLRNRKNLKLRNPNRLQSGTTTSLKKKKKISDGTFFKRTRKKNKLRSNNRKNHKIKM